jgi:deoxyribonuclease IV
MGNRMLLGSHLSVAGGLHNALLAARKYRFDTVALFVRNQRQWACPALAEEEVERFRTLRKELGISPVIAHGSYLMNLCGAEAIRAKSIAALVEDVGRCRRLGIDLLVLHPGSNQDRPNGVRLIAEGLNRALDDAPEQGPVILLETTAGAGRTLGGRFEDLAEILALVDRPERFGVCLDTCHVLAAGYDLRAPEAYAATIGRFDAVIGLPRLKAIHLNDSLGDLGSRLDRHAHIGKGKIGRAGFANLLRDGRLARVPLILETPKGRDSRGRDLDRVNARAVRNL